MSEPRKFSSLLTRPGEAQSAPPGRPRHCSRCLRLAPEYERHDPSWEPPDAASYVKEGVVCWLANCETCNQLEFDAKLVKRFGAIGSPTEPGITDRERERRQYETEKLVRERTRYAKGRRMRKERYAKTSGAILAPSPSTQGRRPASPPSGASIEPAPDYVMLCAEPGEGFADWWETQ